MMAARKSVEEEAVSLLSSSVSHDEHESLLLCEKLGETADEKKFSVTFDRDEFENDARQLLDAPEAQHMFQPTQGWSSKLTVGSIADFLLEYTKIFLLALVPSFISAYWTPTTPSKPRYTAYLDGLRGFAAWTVYNYHLAYVLDKTEKNGWGYEGHNWEFFKLPILRVLYSGSYSVSIFFVISGFALSIAPVLAMRKRKRDAEAFMLKLASVIFRRPMRLYLPSYVSSFAVFIAIRLNYFVYLQRHQRVYERWVPGLWNWAMWPDKLPTFWLQLQDWLIKTRDWNAQYNGVLWTIRLEFYSSLGLYLTHAALYPMARRTRTVMSLLLIIWSMIEASWSMPLFWAGLILADHTQLTADEDLDLLKSRNGSIFDIELLNNINILRRNQRMSKSLATIVPWSVLILGLFLGSLPESRTEDAPGFHWVAVMTPDNYRQSFRFWYGVGAICLVYATSRIPALIWFFTTRLLQYAGRVSFAFYLVHGPIMHGVGRIFFYWSYSTCGRGSFFGFFLGYAILTSFTVWVADLFMRSIDEPLVRAAGKVQKRFFSEVK